eukprot:GCRY01003202.1.p1 GENE.GCRY01003202.1~~GCRY01003202.1.p1  ORF type:complete len:275 (-),score=13.44 GCRY01003202.1:535-1359(-)
MCKQWSMLPKGVTYLIILSLFFSLSQSLSMQLGSKDDECVVCDGGFYANSTCTDECPPDSEIFYCPSKDLCTICGIGTYSKYGASECSPCPEGYSSDKGSSSCTACIPGFANPDEGGVCHKCEKGYFSPRGSPTCNKCPTGTYQNQPGQDTCIYCGKGKYNDETGSNAFIDCKPCPEGFYCPYGNTGDPVLCPSGSFCSKGSIHPSTCAALYESSPGSAECEVNGWFMSMIIIVSLLGLGLFYLIYYKRKKMATDEDILLVGSTIVDEPTYTGL